MAQLINSLRQEERVELICKKNSLNMDLLKRLLKLKMKGYNNTVVAQKLGVHRVTIQRYVETLRKLAQSEFDILYDHILSKKNEEQN